MKIRNLVLAFAAVLFIAPLSIIAEAQTKVVVIDQSKIMQDSRAGKDIASKLKSIADQINNELTPTAEALARENKALNDEIAPLNQNAINQNQALVTRVQSFQKRASEFETKRQTRAAELELTRRDAWQKFFAALAPALEAVIAANQADVVLDRGSVVHASDEIDKTADVIAELDKSSPSIAVTKQKLPANAVPK